MKKLFLTIMIVLLSAASGFAQRITDAQLSDRDYAPSLTIRPLRSSEMKKLNYATALNIVAGCSAVVSGACAAGAVIYEVEYLEEKKNDHFDASASDQRARNIFLAGAATGLLVSSACLVGSTLIKKSFGNKVVVKGTTGGLVVQF